MVTALLYIVLSLLLAIGVTLSIIMSTTWLISGSKPMDVESLLRRRSLLLRVFAAVMILGTILFVAGGVVLFLAAGNVLRLFPGGEVDIRERIAKLQKEISDKEINLARIQSDAAMSNVISGVVTMIRMDSQFILSKEQDFERAREKLRKLLADLSSPEGKVFRSSDYHGFAVEEAQKIDLSEIELRLLKDRIKSVLSDEDLRSLIEVLSDTKELDKKSRESLSTLSDWAVPFDGIMRHNTQQKAKSDADSLKIASERKAKEQQLDRLKSELNEYAEERSNLRMFSWIPDLTVRAGAVVLLLFLTGVFVNTFRYTIALAAFYDSRADALSLAKRAFLKGKIDSEHLRKLVRILHPQDLTIDHTTIPYSFFEKMMEGLSIPKRTK